MKKLGDLVLGSVKGKHLKVLARKLIEKNPGQFTERFADNKLKLKEFRMMEGNREERNKLAGEIGNRVKRKNKPREEMRSRPRGDYGRGERGGYGDRGGRGYGDRRERNY